MNRQDQNDRTSKAQKSPTDRGFPAYFRRILIFSIAKCEKNKFFSSIFNRFINKKMFRFKLLKIRRFFFWESFLIAFSFLSWTASGKVKSSITVTTKNIESNYKPTVYKNHFQMLSCRSISLRNSSDDFSRFCLCT